MQSCIYVHNLISFVGVVGFVFACIFIVTGSFYIASMRLRRRGTKRIQKTEHAHAYHQMNSKYVGFHCIS
jgi:uncharacterized membrane protein YciS (DUF1049 family)